MNAQAWFSDSVRAAAIERKLISGQALFLAGTKSAGLYEVLRGTIRLIRTDRTGKEAVLQIATPGDTLAEASLFASTYHCDAVATTPATVRLYPRALLLAQLRSDPQFATGFAAMLARQVMSLRTRLERRNINSARERVRHFLTVNVGKDGRTVTLSGTLKELAADLGLSHESLYRTLGRMEAEGEIRRVGAKLQIVGIA